MSPKNGVNLRSTINRHFLRLPVRPEYLSLTELWDLLIHMCTCPGYLRYSIKKNIKYSLWEHDMMPMPIMVETGQELAKF